MLDGAASDSSGQLVPLAEWQAKAPEVVQLEAQSQAVV